MNFQAKLLRLPQVIEITSLSKSTIYKWMGEGRFPQNISLSAKCSVWKSQDIEKWNKSLSTLGT